MHVESAIQEAPLSLASFKGIHHGETIVVCGCGESLNLLEHPEQFITIGVNDVGRRFNPNYLVVVNPRNQFKADRFQYVVNSKAGHVFTQMSNLGIPHPRIVRFRLGKYGGTDFTDPEVLHYTRNSPYLAVCLAVYMGARRIGLIGVDFTDHHFFAATGRHPLAPQLEQIDREYQSLARACLALGIEVVNLSPTSRLTALQKTSLEDFAVAAKPRSNEAGTRARLNSGKCFIVNYRFLSCGDVFADGLRHAMGELGCQFEEALWDDPQLPDKIERFRPDLVFVVHGRRFVQKWRDRFRSYNTAVWLVDEPYEVDDTSNWSHHFRTVFVNDPNTLRCHRNAHYLPTCYDPNVHRDEGQTRRYNVGFIGGANATREKCLLRLAEAGLLDYVVGGPWQAPLLQRLCLAPNIPSPRAAELYRQTRIIVNVFRETHHFNRHGIPASSMNPRIYEALACGAGVVSEWRPEIEEVFPEVPTFRDAEELVGTAAGVLHDDRRREQLLSATRARLARHTYAGRLRSVIDIALSGSGAPINESAARWIFARSGGTSEAPRPNEKAVSVAVAPEVVTGPLSGVAGNRVGPVLLRDGMRLCSDGTPRRNLLYHVWPVKGSTWRWNIEQLLRRIDLFNGRRVVSIVHDARSEAPEAVVDLLSDYDCEFVVAPNDARGEAAAFPALLERVRPEGGNQVTFYGHAKGVRHEPQLPETLRKWVDTLYRVNLDDWAAVRTQLGRWPMTGAFKMRGRFRIHQNLGDWHYSGTFFWFRNADVFGRSSVKAPDFYFGVEAWPGILFPATDTGCLLLDNVRRIPYDERFWREAGDRAVAAWQSQQRGLPAPSDLAQPRPYDGYDWPRLEQIPEEFDWWIGLLLQERASSLLTIGAGHGGVEWHVARKFREAGRDIFITCVDTKEHPELTRSLDDIRSRFGQRVELVRGESATAETAERLDLQYDAVFIDADHGYRSVATDFRLALSRKPRVVGLHDIVDSDWHAASHCCVSRLWDTLRFEYETQERRSGDWGGIGVVWPERRRST
jgi:hypothetical protein